MRRRHLELVCMPSIEWDEIVLTALTALDGTDGTDKEREWPIPNCMDAGCRRWC